MSKYRITLWLLTLVGCKTPPDDFLTPARARLSTPARTATAAKLQLLDCELYPALEAQCGERMVDAARVLAADETASLANRCDDACRALGLADRASPRYATARGAAHAVCARTGRECP